MSESSRTILDRYMDHCRSGDLREDAKQIDNSKRKSIVRNKSISVVSLLKLLSTGCDVLNVADRHGRDQRVEILQG